MHFGENPVKTNHEQVQVMNKWMDYLRQNSLKSEKVWKGGWKKKGFKERFYKRHFDKGSPEGILIFDGLSSSKLIFNLTYS